MLRISSNSAKVLADLKVRQNAIQAKASAGLYAAGGYLEGKMAEKISLGQLSPALQPATIARKGSSKPLFDKGHLLQQIDIKQETNGSVEVGVFNGPEERAYIALIHEYGAPKRNIPERSFMRSAYNENKDKMNKIFENKMK